MGYVSLWRTLPLWRPQLKEDPAIAQRTQAAGAAIVIAIPVMATGTESLRAPSKVMSVAASATDRPTQIALTLQFVFTLFHIVQIAAVRATRHKQTEPFPSRTINSFPMDPPVNRPGRRVGSQSSTGQTSSEAPAVPAGASGLWRITACTDRRTGDLT